MRTRLVLVGLLTLAALPALCQWKLRSTSGPTPRYDAAMTYSYGRKAQVLFGGFDGSSPYADTWEWNGTSWTQGPAGPSARSQASIAYDTVRNKVVLFGGTNNGVLGDTWEYDGTWTNTNAVGPPARRSGAMCYDPVHGYTLLYGGMSGDNMNDTWKWDGKTWTQLFPPNHPVDRFSCTLVFDQNLQKLVLFGGGIWQGRIYHTTYVWTGSDWTLLPTAEAPGHRDYSMAYNEVYRRTMFFGGIEAYGTSLHASGGFWTFDSSRWVSEPATGPVDRSNACMAYDNKRKVMLLFGGLDASGTPLRDSWEWTAPVPTAGVSVTSSSVVSGNSQTLTITLPANAGPDGILVKLSSNSANATCVPSVRIAAGQKTIDVPIDIGFVASNTNVQVFATIGERTSAVAFTIVPADLSSLAFANAQVTGGSKVKATVTLNGTAPPSGATVTLSSSSGDIAFPSTVKVLAGARTVTFDVSTSAVESETTAQLDATYNGVTVSGTVTLEP